MAEVEREIGDIGKGEFTAHPLQKLAFIHLLLQLLPNLHHRLLAPHHDRFKILELSRRDIAVIFFVPAGGSDIVAAPIAGNHKQLNSN